MARSCQLQLKLWMVGLFGLGFLWLAAPAVAQETAVDTETVDTPRNGHDCYDLETEQPGPLGEFRGAALETAAIAARSINSTEKSVGSLIQLSEAYACLGQVEASAMLAEEAIALIPDVEHPISQMFLLTRIAGAYGEDLDDDYLREQLSLIRSGSEGVDDYTRSDLIYLMIDLNDFSQIEEVANTIEDSRVLVEVITELVGAGYEDMAQRLSANITSPLEQVYAALNIAEAFWNVDRPERVYELAAVGIEILQDDALYEDEAFRGMVAYYGQNNPAVSEEEIYRTFREGLVLDFLELLDDDSVRRPLFVQLIEDDAFRESLMVDVSLNDGVSEAVLDPASDADWGRVASQSASEGSFLQAVEAIAMMESPNEQVRSLITIAQCYVNSTTELDDETYLLLQEIQQRTL